MAEDNKRFWVEAIPHNNATNEGDVVGYMYHRRIKVGQKFQVTEKEFSKKWMQRIPEKKAKEAAEQQLDLKVDKRRAEEEESVL